MTDLEQAFENLVALEAQIDKLNNLRQKVETEGMSRGVALEAREVFADFDGHRPLAFYSNEPSAVKQVQALESMGAGVLALVIAAVSALAYLIGTAIGHFFGGKRGDKGLKGTYTYRGKSYSTYEEAATQRDKDVHDYFKEMADEAHQQNMKWKDEADDLLRQAKSSTPTQADKLLEDALRTEAKDGPIHQLMVSEDPFLTDFIMRGGYSVAVTQSLSTTKTLKKGLVDLSGDIHALLRDMKSVMDSHPMDDRSVKDQLSRVMQMTGGVWVTGNFRTKVQDILDEKDKVYSRSSQQLKYADMAKRIPEAIGHVSVGEIRDVYDSCEEELPAIKRKLEELASDFGKYEKMGDLTNTERGYLSYVSDAVKAMRAELTLVMKYLVILEQYSRTVHNANQRLYKLQRELVKLTAEYARKNGTLTPEMKKLEKEVLDELTIDI
jgi:hypothetical protein